MRPRRDDKNLKSSELEPEQDYEGGARKYPLAPDAESQDIDQRAAENKRRVPYGLTEALDESPQETARSDNVDLHLAPAEPDQPAADDLPSRPGAGAPEK